MFNLFNFQIGEAWSQLATQNTSVQWKPMINYNDDDGWRLNNLADMALLILRYDPKCCRARIEDGIPDNQI